MNRSTLFVFFAIIIPGVLQAQTPGLGAKDYTNAILWQQRSGEYRALSFQAYNYARLSLDQRLKDEKGGKLNCVVVDIDETVLDNSRFQASEVKKGISFDPLDWAKWTTLGIADTVPGALSFLKYAAGKNVETFYISNRMLAEQDGTLKNLKSMGFPFADVAHLILKSTTSDKEPRRQQLSEKYNILLLCGDNLGDFSNVFYREGKNTKEQVDQAQALFGARFIVLPNPMYGDWENQFYKGGKFDELEKSHKRAEALNGY